MSLSSFPSQILVCAMVFSAHYLFSRFDLGRAFKQKIKIKNKKRVGRDIGTNLHMSQESTKLLTNHLWQVWRSIYNNHIDFKMFPTKIQVHREQAKLINAQSY